MKCYCLQAIKDAEGDLEIAKLNEMKARESLEKAKLKLRDSQAEGSLLFYPFVHLQFHGMRWLCQIFTIVVSSRERSLLEISFCESHIRIWS